jgi:hypothetical protein
LAEITKALPPQVQQFVIDFVIEASDHPDRKKMGKRIRSALGIPEDGVDGEQQIDPAVEQIKTQATEQIQALTEQLQAMMAELEAAKKEASDKSGALEVQRAEVDRKSAADQEKIQIERERMAAEQARQNQESADKQAEADRQKDEQFLSSLMADANENGIPDIDEVATMVIKKVTPVIEQGLAKITKSIEDMRASENKEHKTEATEPADD